MRGGGAGFVGFSGQDLLLGYGFSLGFFGFFLLARSFLRCGGGLLCGGLRFLLHALSFGLGLFGLGASLLGLSTSLLSFGTAPAFGFGVGAGFGLASPGFSLRFFFRLLFY